MIQEIEFNEIPAFLQIKERIFANNPSVEFVTAAQDKDPDSYLLKLRLARQTTLRLPKELLDDLPGKNNEHRKAQLELKIRTALARIK